MNGLLPSFPIANKATLNISVLNLLLIADLVILLGHMFVLSFGSSKLGSSSRLEGADGWGLGRTEPISPLVCLHPISHMCLKLGWLNSIKVKYYCWIIVALNIEGNVINFVLFMQYHYFLIPQMSIPETSECHLQRLSLRPLQCSLNSSVFLQQSLAFHSPKTPSKFRSL